MGVILTIASIAIMIWQIVVHNRRTGSPNIKNGALVDNGFSSTVGNCLNNINEPVPIFLSYTLTVTNGSSGKTQSASTSVATARNGKFGRSLVIKPSLISGASTYQLVRNSATSEDALKTNPYSRVVSTGSLGSKDISVTDDFSDMEYSIHGCTFQFS